MIHVTGGRPVADFDWQLERLFSARLNATSPLKSRWFETFRNGFRSALHRHDHGFPYHHWLLAQLPWTRIITTNFDGYHERAAATVAASPRLKDKDRDHVLSLGSPLPDIPDRTTDDRSEPSQPQAEKLRRDLGELRARCRLFKPYGSLLIPAPLELAAEQLEGCQTRLRIEFEVLLEPAAAAWLVVVGHAMRDPYVDGLLSYLQHLPSAASFPRRTRVLWVVPEALERSRRAVPGSGAPQRLWDEWMHRLWNGGQGDSGPLPAQASELSYDLWKTYQRLG